MRGKHFAVLGLGNFGSVVVSELLKLKCLVFLKLMMYC